MFCSNCGKEIPDDSVKCPDCGQEIKREQPQTNKKDALSFLEKLHPFTLTALVLSALSVLLFIFEIVFMAKIRSLRAPGPCSSTSASEGCS